MSTGQDNEEREELVDAVTRAQEAVAEGRDPSARVALALALQELENFDNDQE